MSIEVHVVLDVKDALTSYIIGRNGTWTPTAMVMWQGEGPTAHIDAVGKRGRMIRGGLSLPAEKLDKLAMRWLQARGLVMPAVNNKVSKRIMAREEKG